jgi:endonuclease/exonuclease/phosphatase family metal-dependent hydrolase
LGGEGDTAKQNAMGYGLDPMVDLLRHLSPDFVLLTEVERGCSWYENGAAYLAEQLQMEWTYVVEFVPTMNSDRDEEINQECSMGNAILSKWPLSDHVFTRFDEQCCW